LVHGLITSRETKEDNQIVLEAGKPMVFGRDNEKGIILRGTRLEVVKIGEKGIGLDDLLVHDPTTPDPGIHMMLADMKPPMFPAALGVIRAVDSQTFEDEIWDSIEVEKKRSPHKNVDDLLSTGNTWVIE
jgi:2-oxoglutarate ferredoxin oxidoreductase subunit beta